MYVQWLHRNSEKSLWLIGLFQPSFGKDFDDEVVTEQLTAVVDVTFMPHGDPEIS